MERKSIAYLIVVIVIASIALFSGCVEEETIAPMETPAVDTTPISTPEQEIVLPTPTPEVTVLPALEPGYEWYQDDEYGYKIAYPKDWDTMSGKFDLEMYPQGYIDMYPQGFTSNFGEEELLSSLVKINVRVTSNQTVFRFWETGVFFGMSQEIPIGLEELKKQERIVEYNDITVNGKDGIEVVFDPIILYSGSEGLAPPSTTRFVFFTNDDLDYTIMTTSDNRFYSKYKDTFEYVINSFIID
jgi:hypothetical protein